MKQHSKGPSRIIQFGLAVLVLLGLVAVASAQPEPAPATATPSATITMQPVAITLQEVPMKIMAYLTGKYGKTTAKNFLQAQGYACMSELACYTEGSYDPPRWGNGTVSTGNGPGGYLRVRSWTGSQYSHVRSFKEGWKLHIYCQTRGEWVYGRWGWTNIWDFVGLENGETPRFVSDGFVYTGSNSYVAGSCTSTNYGDMAW